MVNLPPTTPPVGSTPPPPPYGSPPPRQLRRRPDEGPVAGVCAGVAEYFNLDPVIVRIAAVVLAFAGPGVFAYVLAWIFVPEADASSRDPFARPPSDRRDRGAQIFGIVLLAVSVSILWGGWWSPARRFVFPLGLMALGAWLLFRRDRDADADGDLTSASSPPSVPTAPWSPTSASVDTPDAASPWASATTALDAPAGPAGLDGDTTNVGAADPSESDVDPTLEGTPLADVSSGGAASPPWSPGWAPTAWGPPRRPEVPEEVRAARRRRRMVFPMVMGALLLWAGIGFLAGVSVQTGLAIALCIVGIGFVLGAFVGGSKALIVPAFLVGAALLATSVLDLPLSGPIGDQTWRPQTEAQLQDRYELSIGEGVLDLSELRLDDGDEVTIEAAVGIGHLVIEVPDGVALDVTAATSAGDALLLGHSTSGLGVSVQRSYSGDGTSGTVVLDLEVGLGQVEVRRLGADSRDRPPTSTTVLG